MLARQETLRLLWLGVGAATLVALLVLLRGLLTPLFFALLLAYMLDPLVDRFEAVRIPRPLGIVVLLALVLSLLSLFAILVLPTLVRDLVALAQALSEALSRLLESAGPWLRERGVRVPESAESALQALGARAMGLGPTALAPVGSAITAAWGGTAQLLSALGTFLLVPVFSFYFLDDFDRIVARVHDLLPLRSRPGVVALANEIHGVLGHFVRGQLTVMAVLGTLYAVGYAVVGVPLAVPIGALAGLLSFIPYVGSGLALIIGLLMVLLHFTSFTQVVLVVAIYVLVQVLDGLFITPRIMGGKLGLSPVWVLFALLAFGKLFGFVGVMVALPASAVIKVFVVHGLRRYRQSAYYLGQAQSPSRAGSGRLRLRRRRRPRAPAGS